MSKDPTDPPDLHLITNVPDPSKKRTGRDEAARMRSLRALEMRMAGASYSQIAVSLKFSNRGNAYRSVQAALAYQENISAELREEYRTLQLARTERMLLAIWPRAVQGEHEAIVDSLRILERQAKLVGLDAPTRIDITETTRSQVELLITDLEEHLIIPEQVASGDDG